MNHNNLSPTVRGTVDIIRYFCTCTVLKLAIMILLTFPFLSNQLQDQTMHVFIAVVRKELKKIIQYKIVIVKLNVWIFI